MSKLSKAVLIFLLLEVIFGFFYFKKQMDAINKANNDALIKMQEAEAIRNRPFPLAGMDEGGENTWDTFTDKVQNITFKYPTQIGTKYIHPTIWPPKVTISNGPFVCKETGSEIMQGGITEKIIVNSNIYCLTKENEGAAGSIYTNYTYKTTLKDKVISLTFTLQAVQCVNYDDPLKTECANERRFFDISGVINTIVSTIQTTTNIQTKKVSGISGTVLLGPICPVMRDPPDPGCADKPYKTQLVITAQNSMKVIKEFSSDVNGKFSIELPIGSYLISNAPGSSMLPRCASNGNILVTINQYTNTIVSCDTGIR